MLKCILFVVFLFTSSVAYSTTITTCPFSYDNDFQAVFIDMGQFPLNVETELHFVFRNNYPSPGSQVHGGAIFWNQVNRVDAGVFYGNVFGRSYFSWDTSLNTSNIVANYNYTAVDPNNEIFGYVNNMRYFTDLWDYQSGKTTIYIQPADIDLNPIPVTETDFYNRFFYIGETWDGGPSPTEWLQPEPVPIPEPTTLLLLGSACLSGIVFRRKLRRS